MKQTKRIIFIVIVVICITFSSTISALAVSVVSDSSNLLSSYNRSLSGDRYSLNWSTNSITKMVAKQSSSSSFSDTILTVNHIASEQGYSYFSGVSQAVNEYWTFDLYNASGSLLGVVKFDSTVSGSGDNPSSSGSDSLLRTINNSILSNGKTFEEGITVLHGDLYSLSLTLNSIKEATRANGTRLDTIIGQNDIMIDQNNELLRQLTSDKSYSSGAVPSVEIPSADKYLEQDKPQSSNTAYKDDTVYFKDEGDVAESPSALPATPDIKDWDGVTRQNELTVEDSLTSDSPLNRDLELTLNPFNQDPLLDLPSFNKDPEMNVEVMNPSEQLSKDTEMTSDILQKDSEMALTPFEQTETYSSGSELIQNHVYEKSPEMSVIQ